MDYLTLKVIHIVSSVLLVIFFLMVTKPA